MMPMARELSIRGAPIHMLQEGRGPDLLVRHGARGAGRWRPFQEHLARAHVDETAGVRRQSRSVSE
jgi:hypothetical protein